MLASKNKRSQRKFEERNIKCPQGKFCLPNVKFGASLFELAHLEQLIAKESHPSKLLMKHSTKVYHSFLVGRYFIA
ncbi:MAG: hypothetical protein E7206_09925 [Clostridium beijerinckii]|nr:hypothetical protein [Clostridium beijerinckii]